MCRSALLHDEYVDDGLDIVDVAHQPFQCGGFNSHADATLQPHPAALTFDPNARLRKVAIGKNGLLDARNDFLVVEVRVRQPAAPG